MEAHRGHVVPPELIEMVAAAAVAAVLDVVYSWPLICPRRFQLQWARPDWAVRLSPPTTPAEILAPTQGTCRLAPTLRSMEAGVATAYPHFRTGDMAAAHWIMASQSIPICLFLTRTLAGDVAAMLTTHLPPMAAKAARAAAVVELVGIIQVVQVSRHVAMTAGIAPMVAAVAALVAASMTVIRAKIAGLVATGMTALGAITVLAGLLQATDTTVNWVQA